MSAFPNLRIKNVARTAYWWCSATGS